MSRQRSKTTWSIRVAANDDRSMRQSLSTVSRIRPSCHEMPVSRERPIRARQAEPPRTSALARLALSSSTSESERRASRAPLRSTRSRRDSSKPSPGTASSAASASAIRTRRHSSPLSTVLGSMVPGSSSSGSLGGSGAIGRGVRGTSAHRSRRAPRIPFAYVSPPLRIDPIAEARRQWEARWGAEPSRAMAAVTSIMRAQQILMARLNELLRPHGLTFPRYEALMLLSFTPQRRAAAGQDRRAPAGPPDVSVTNIIDELEADGLVRARAATSADRRATLAEITDAGPRGRGGRDRGAQRRALRHRAARAARARAPHDHPARACGSTPGDFARVASRSPRDTRTSYYMRPPIQRATPTVPTTDDEWRAAYGAHAASATPRSPRSRGEPIQPLYTEADLPPTRTPTIGLPGAVSRSRAASTRRCTAAGCGRCASSPASAPPRRPTSASATCSTTGRPGCRRPSTCPR